MRLLWGALVSIILAVEREVLYMCSILDLSLRGKVETNQLPRFCIARSLLFTVMDLQPAHTRLLCDWMDNTLTWINVCHCALAPAEKLWLVERGKSFLLTLKCRHRVIQKWYGICRLVPATTCIEPILLDWLADLRTICTTVKQNLCMACSSMFKACFGPWNFFWMNKIWTVHLL